ncbi:amino acid adenylation domain-containing protein [Magnetospira sp. QH-2]|uniref:amino acid adenylation domain-containing protein n=1 Tax=Magnetospira sp. (strain QH-2) TaxID=1288970 RepID=UPI0003E80E02|nr:amino acid adenylation domain-containing protein [Magnetospira sp. QH-2]CCQ73080.1 putative D-alanine--poly(phosphoribitol) ligase dltA [Magnetospira sp. QH-2]
MTPHPSPGPSLDKTLLGQIHARVLSQPEAIALWADGEGWTYHELWHRAQVMASAINERGGSSPVCALYAFRNGPTYAAILGILLAGRAYLPINPHWPSARCLAVLVQAGTDCVVCASADRSEVQDLLSHGALEDRPQILPIPEQDTAVPKQAETASLLAARDQPLAYLLFTSGSTGAPKGVPIAKSCVESYVSTVRERYGFCSTDRLSQVFDLTFDLSVHDLFVAWTSGAALYCVPDRELVAPAAFIETHRLTCWFSTPSMATLLDRFGLLDPGRFDSLRLSLFCGEPLTQRMARAWARAAPNGPVENLYGPTEATIATTAHVFDPDREAQGDLVPIGQSFPDQVIQILTDDGTEAAQGEPGELLISGPQLCAGYWRDPNQTQERFIRLPGSDAVWYRTGDLVHRDSEGDLHFRGRLDHQIKVRGHRVELGEIEAVLRSIAQTDQVAAFGWPRSEGTAQAVAAFVADSPMDNKAIQAACRDRLPSYMVPSAIRRLDRLPLNTSGKIDRAALMEQLDSNHREDGDA